MEEKDVTQRLRRFLLGVVAAILVVTPLELILLEHTEEMLQWIPFVVSGLGLLAVGGVWFVPETTSLKVFRWVMVIVALSSFAGVYLHFSSNLSFTREINPSFTLMESLWPAFKGSNPLLAPGIMFLAGVLGLGAIYRHPLLNE